MLTTTHYSEGAMSLIDEGVAEGRKGAALEPMEVRLCAAHQRDAWHGMAWHGMHAQIAEMELNERKLPYLAIRRKLPDGSVECRKLSDLR
jgi:hypothetical protein